MPVPKLTDQEFIEAWNSHESAADFARVLGVNLSSLRKRRRRIENRYKINLEAKQKKNQYAHYSTAGNHAARYAAGIENGIVIVFSDAHFWPGLRSTAFKGLLWAIEKDRKSTRLNSSH